LPLLDDLRIGELAWLGVKHHCFYSIRLNGIGESGEGVYLLWGA